MISITSEVKLPAAVKRAVIKTAKAAIKLEDSKADVSVLITDDEDIQRLNKEFRDMDKPTDVLSFPAQEDGFLGDIAISFERAQKQAQEYGHSVEREMAFLTAHAMLHLFGLDHIEEADDNLMRQRQRQILKKSGYDIK